MRYAQLLTIIDEIKPQTIIEIGTWNGDRAIEMINQSAKYNKEIQYTGYDLFELATEETDRIEFNVKKHFTQINIMARIKSAVPWNTMIKLIKGDTRKTLTQQKADFAFIDGGHSVETIRSDYANLKDCACVVLDDYYMPIDGHGPNNKKFGCNELLGKEIPKWELLPALDPVKGGGLVGMVRMR